MLTAFDSVFRFKAMHSELVQNAFVDLRRGDDMQRTIGLVAAKDGPGHRTMRLRTWARGYRIFRFLKKGLKRIWRAFHFARNLRWPLQLLLLEPGLFFAQLALRRGDGLSGRYQWRRLVEIRRVLRRLRIQSALEFGSGASTLLFQKYVPNFASIEESPEWRDAYIKKLESAWSTRRKARRIQSVIVLAERIQTQDLYGEEITQYCLPADLLLSHFELLYIDGPQNSELVPATGRVRDPHHTLPNVDALRWINQADLLVVDQRRATVAYFCDYLPPEWLLATDLLHDFDARAIYHSFFLSHKSELAVEAVKDALRIR